MQIRMLSINFLETCFVKNCLFQISFLVKLSTKVLEVKIFQVNFTRRVEQAQTFIFWPSTLKKIQNILGKIRFLALFRFLGLRQGTRSVES
jgi:hypothetical protein